MAEPDVEKEIHKDLDETVAAVPSDIAVQGVVLKGRPWRELEARSSELDLLFIGSRGYGPLQAVVLGATNGPLMREAHCPVIALPRGATRRWSTCSPRARGPRHDRRHTA